MTITQTTPLSKNEINDAIVENPGYLVRCCQQRAAGPTQAGSFYNKRATDIVADILLANWAPYAHPSVTDGCLAFKASLPGILGVVHIDALPTDTEFLLIDPKGVGKASLAAKFPAASTLPEVEFSVLILGPKEGEEEGLTLWTFHPGDPVRASEAVMELPPGGRPTTKEEALSLGLTYAKVIPG